MEALGQRRAAHLLGNFVLEKIRIKPGRQQSPEMQSPASVGLSIGSTSFLSWRCGQASISSLCEPQFAHLRNGENTNLTVMGCGKD